MPANPATGAGLALEDICNSIIKYGYGNDRRHESKLRTEEKNLDILIRCVYEGHKFNPRLRFFPEVTDKNTEERPENCGGVP